MYKMFSNMRAWLARFFEVGAAPEAPADPLSRMSPSELADLPVHHPSFDRCLGT